MKSADGVQLGVQLGVPAMQLGVLTPQLGSLSVQSNLRESSLGLNGEKTQSHVNIQPRTILQIATSGKDVHASQITASLASPT